MEERDVREVDVLIIGAGLAGLTLARQLLLARPEMNILMLDRQAEIPSPKQKVGEATVQVSGYYYSRVLEMEEHLLREHSTLIASARQVEPSSLRASSFYHAHA